MRALVRVPSRGGPVAVADARADVAKLHGTLSVQEVVLDPYLFPESGGTPRGAGRAGVRVPADRRADGAGLRDAVRAHP